MQRAKTVVYGNETGSQYYRNDYGNIIRIRQGYTFFLEDEDLLAQDSLISEELPFINTEYRELYYTYNDAGLMSSRKDSVTHFREIFEYDNLDRLTAFTIANADSSVFEYHTTSFADNGNIMANSHIGAYSYDSDKPHAVTGITLDSAHANAISAAQCDVHYNLFNQPDTITEGQWQLILYYGPDWTRWKTVLKKNGNVVETHWYVGDSYEKVTNNGSTVHHNIVSGEENAKVICRQGYGSNAYYYVYPDILGSWCVISGQSKRLSRSIHFDPWGNPRKFNNWTLVDSTALANTILPARGFTGHEHLQRFNIINMKGRLYDPVIGRFFSPDNFVQLPDFTQNYNRYSYCLNNPLTYVDPSGEFFWIPIVVGAVIGGVVNLGIKASQGQINSWVDGLAAFGIGAVAGAVGAFTGGVAFAAAGGAAAGAGGFLAGAAGGIAGSAFATPIQSIGNSMYFGDPMITGKQYFASVAIGGLVGGVINGSVALWNGKNFWTGSNRNTNFSLSGIASNSIVEEQQNKLNTGDNTRLQSQLVHNNHEFTVETIEPLDSYSIEGRTIIMQRPEINGYKPFLADKTDLYHNFPKEFDALIVQKGSWSWRINDHVVYNNIGHWFECYGMIDNVRGVYQIGLNENGIIFHRAFIPYH